MSFGKQRLSLEDIKQMDLVDFLSALGYPPSTVRGNNYWYFSPFREERTASFKVDRRINRWYDHGEGKGGNLIDFGMAYYRCSLPEFLEKVSGNYSFQIPQTRQPVVTSDDKGKIRIVSETNLKSFSLWRYLQQRHIPVDVARKYCRELRYDLYDKHYYGIGFKNDSGGFEIRNPFFKASSSPKDITTLGKEAKTVAVFEGFMDFLSFQTIHQSSEILPQNFVILNSISFFEKARIFLEQHESVRLFLDRDTAGKNLTAYALSIGDKYRDESSLYEHYKDLNDWAMHFGKQSRQRLGHGL